MNPKVQKLVEEIDKTKKKIADQQTRLKELERQKTEIENTDIVAMIRGLDVAPENLKDLKVFIELFQQQNNENMNTLERKEITRDEE